MFLLYFQVSRADGKRSLGECNSPGKQRQAEGKEGERGEEGKGGGGLKLLIERD